MQLFKRKVNKILESLSESNRHPMETVGKKVDGRKRAIIEISIYRDIEGDLIEEAE